ncbi:FAD-dependent oxidoreductase, partial [Staphylococcus saprophyticus]
LEDNAKSHGLDFVGGEYVQRIEGDNDGNITQVVTDKNTYEADTVIFAVGVKPATEWLDGKIELGDKGVINIDEHLQTSAKDVYAGGDATLIP